MKSGRIAAAWTAGILIASALAPATLQAQDYPNRPVNVVVPFPAGGPSDVVARIVTEQMGKALGQTLVIENVGGAGGTIGSGRVAAAAPDGYTLLAGSMGSHVAAPVLTPGIRYDPRDFVPIGPTAHSPAVIVARKNFPAKDLREFVADVKEKGDGVKQAHGGIGASSHMACLLFNTEAGVEADAGRLSRHRTGDERPDRRPCRLFLRAVGERDRAGEVRRDQGLCGVGGRRLAALPDVPTAKEMGVNYAMSIWAGIFAPKGTPRAGGGAGSRTRSTRRSTTRRAAAHRHPRRLDPRQGGAHSDSVRGLREGRDRALGANPQGGGRRAAEIASRSLRGSSRTSPRLFPPMRPPQQAGDGGI